jgi:cation transport ATPase
MTSEWEAVERAEARLSARAVERRAARDRAARRRVWLPWLLGVLVLPVLGSAVLVWMLAAAGGDLRSWPPGLAALALAAAVLWPVPVVLWAARHRGRAERAALAVVAVALLVGLSLGVGLALLGLGAG